MSRGRARGELWIGLAAPLPLWIAELALEWRWLGSRTRGAELALEAVTALALGALAGAVAFYWRRRRARAVGLLGSMVLAALGALALALGG